MRIHGSGQKRCATPADVVLKEDKCAPLQRLIEIAASSVTKGLQLLKTWRQDASAKQAATCKAIETELSGVFEACAEAGHSRDPLVLRTRAVAAKLYSIDDAVVRTYEHRLQSARGSPLAAIRYACTHLQELLQQQRRLIVTAQACAARHKTLLAQEAPWADHEAKPDLRHLKDTDKELRQTTRKVSNLKCDLDDAVADHGQDSAEAAEAKLAVKAAQDLHRQLQKRKDRELAVVAKLKAEFFPELKVDVRIKASLGSSLRAAGKVSDNFDLRAVDHSVIVWQGRHRILKVCLDDKEESILKEYLLGPDGLGTLQKEAGLLHRLQHPHIVELKSVHIDDRGAAAFLEMPYYEGGTILEWLSSGEGPRPHSLVVRMLHQVVQAVEFLHRNKVIHSDIHPENIFIERVAALEGDSESKNSLNKKGNNDAKAEIDSISSSEPARRWSEYILAVCRQVHPAVSMGRPAVEKTRAMLSEVLYCITAVVKALFDELSAKEQALGISLLLIECAVKTVLKDLFYYANEEATKAVAHLSRNSAGLQTSHQNYASPKYLPQKCNITQRDVIT